MSAVAGPGSMMRDRRKKGRLSEIALRELAAREESIVTTRCRCGWEVVRTLAVGRELFREHRQGCRS